MTEPRFHALLASIEATAAGLEDAGYIPNRQTATAVFLAHHLRKPILRHDLVDDRASHDR